MHRVIPQVFLIGETKTNEEGLHQYLEHIGASNWTTDASSDVEEIIEVGARGCYMAFEADTGGIVNRNLVMLRLGNQKYLENIINVGHGSVLEHGFVNFMFVDVSRVFTHELIRHRAGVAISQESLRFVKLGDMGMWIPSCFEDNPEAIEVFKKVWQTSEIAYTKLLLIAALDIEKKADYNDLSFKQKRRYTSAARRIVPIGMATNIAWSCNIRTLRHVIEMRTAPESEEEIRFIFAKVGWLAKKEWPNLFRDYTIERVDGIHWFHTEHAKV